MIALAAVTSSAAHAQTGSPSAIARAYFDAIAIENWEAAASLLRADDMERIRREGIASFRPREIRTLTADDFLRHDSAMPRAFAQYQADQVNKRMREFPDIGGLQHEFANVKDTAQLASLSVVQAGARWIEARDMRFQMRQLLSRSPDCPKGTYSAATASMVPRFDILGEVVRADTAWVLYRKVGDGMDIPAPFSPGPSMVVLYRNARGWRIVPREEYGHGAGSGGLIGVSCDRSSPRD
jgi:hypothetical protein